MSPTPLLILGVFILGHGDGLGLSTRMASSVCRQREEFFTSQTIQPVQKKSPQEQVTCGRFLSQKCVPDETLKCGETPSFQFLPCEKAGRNVMAALRKLGAVSMPNVLVRFKKSSSDVYAGILENLAKAKSVDRVTQRLSTIKSLREFSFKLQKDVIDFIQSSVRADSVQTTSLWLTNQILLKGADLVLINKLMENFPGDIAEISDDKSFKIVKPLAPPGSGEAPEGWGVERIEADKVWEEGNKGEGVIVGLIDTGAIATHNYLKDNFVGSPLGFFDGIEGKDQPYDQAGHGTHTTCSVAATQKKIGVAPGSKWMHCIGCNEKDCPKSAVIKCFQWMLCPSNRPGQGTIDDQQDGEKCEGAPHVISNSWASDEGPDEDINNAIKAVAAAGIINVFAAGNGGNTCETLFSPNELEEVISVGATVNAGNGIAAYSSRGPFKGTTRVKPDIVAPGNDILSCHISDDDSTLRRSGTSMAAPHVSGVIALLLHEKPDLTLVQVKEILFKSAVPLNITEGDDQACGGVQQTVVPNNVWGHGLLNAYNAVQYLKENFKK